jgi:hypothetical protein
MAKLTKQQKLDQINVITKEYAINDCRKEFKLPKSVKIKAKLFSHGGIPSWWSCTFKKRVGDRFVDDSMMVIINP